MTVVWITVGENFLIRPKNISHVARLQNLELLSCVLLVFFPCIVSQILPKVKTITRKSIRVFNNDLDTLKENVQTCNEIQGYVIVSDDSRLDNATNYREVTEGDRPDLFFYSNVSYFSSPFKTDLHCSKWYFKKKCSRDAFILIATNWTFDDS